MSPERSDLVLSTHIPNIKLDVLVCNGFDIKADGGNCGNILVKLELVEDGYRTG